MLPFLDCEWYTRPWEFEGRTPPEVLNSGHHANIEKVAAPAGGLHERRNVVPICWWESSSRWRKRRNPARRGEDFGSGRGEAPVLQKIVSPILSFDSN